MTCLARPHAHGRPLRDMCAWGVSYPRDMTAFCLVPLHLPAIARATLTTAGWRCGRAHAPPAQSSSTSRGAAASTSAICVCAISVFLGALFLRCVQMLPTCTLVLRTNWCSNIRAIYSVIVKMLTCPHIPANIPQFSFLFFGVLGF